MSNQVFNAHITLGSPLGNSEELAEVADWAGDILLMIYRVLQMDE